jgi:hypothetical protein
MAQLEPCLNGVRGTLNNLIQTGGEVRSEVANELEKKSIYINLAE